MICRQGWNILFLFDIFKFDFYCSHITVLADVLVIYLFLFFICTIAIIVAKPTTCYFHLIFFLIISNMVVIMYHSSRLSWCQGFAVKELKAFDDYSRCSLMQDNRDNRDKNGCDFNPLLTSYDQMQQLWDTWVNLINWWQPLDVAKSSQKSRACGKNVLHEMIIN